jgi:YVTN family beta-propeller protein
VAYVSDSSSGTVTPINTATNTAGPPIVVGKQPWDMTVTPGGNTVYVTNDDASTVTPINTATNTAGPPIVVGKYANSIAIIP